MGKIDTEGTFIGEIVESAISTTKNGFPQWTPRLLAVSKWIDNAEDMKHFGLTEPAYVDWSSFSEDTVAFLSLYGNPKDGGDPVPTLNYEQAQLATGWDGSDFEALNSYVGTHILFRVQSNTYQDKTSLQVSWIDSKDASATKTLKALDSAAIKDLNAKFLKGAAKKPVVAAAKPAAPTKPVTKPGKSPVGSAGAPSAAPSATPSPVVAATPAAETAPSTTASQKTTSPSKAPTPPKKKTSTPPPQQPAEEKVAAELPTETSQADAWEYVSSNKGANEDTAVEEAWIAACQEVGADRDEDAFTPSDWAKVRNIVIKDLAL